ncbi:hypothetical protein CVT26_004052 [Gymnopilus dilepis]|uniref:Chitin-binding type-2 domain-containing protein n=1 Tax=Gymnopilus dilepis TaxID=231916 RepID=A0A409WKS4_9AGAR|nr:hypothetical protein CVT26_004052 [Gymnopilus dilepis]
MPLPYRPILFTFSVLVASLCYFVSRSSHYESFYKRDVEAIQSNAQVSPSNSSNNATDLCANPPRGHCEFYRACLESKFHCGPDGYPLGYGEKFCQKFQADQAELSTAGREWMLDTMQCLQRALVPEAESPTGADQAKSCDDLKEKAFASHAPCYIDNGLCTLSPVDWEHIVAIIGLQTLLGSWDALKETLEAAEGCLYFYAFLVASKL